MPRMLRLIGFFVVVLLVVQLLRHVPVVGALFQIPILGFWGAAILVSALASKLAVVALDRSRFARRRRELGHVETPHNQGKLGVLLLTSGRTRAAIAPLENAVRGEPNAVEWRYRLGSALLASGRAEDAAAELTRAAAIDGEHAYGVLRLRLAEALAKCKRHDEVIAVLDHFDHDHGANAESAYRRGRSLRALGRRDEANESFRRASELARTVARYQRTHARTWAWRAFLARLT
jgi:tetratricopeptide (TPR) repeat protein